MIETRVPCSKVRAATLQRGPTDDLEGSASIGQPCSPINADPLRSRGGHHDDDRAADLDLVALLEPLGREHAAAVEPGAVGRAEVLDEPVAVGWLEQSVVAGRVLVVEHQAALPAGGELGVEDVRLVTGLDGDRLGRGALGDGGFTRARYRGDNGPPGVLLLVADVVPGWEGTGMSTAVGIVGGLGETVEIDTGHQSIMPEQGAMIVRTPGAVSGGRLLAARPGAAGPSGRPTRPRRHRPRGTR